MVSFRSLVSLSTVALLSAHGAAAAALHPKMYGAGSNGPLAKKQTTTDVCAEVNLNAALGLLDLVGVSVSPLKICLCLSGLAAYLEADVAAAAVIQLLGIGAVEASLTALINANGQQCSYPQNSAPQCSSREPCGFTCSHPYVRMAGQCRLPASPRSLSLKRDLGWCPKGMTKCGVPNGRDSFDCVNTRTSLESCGGCATALLGDAVSGQDCTAIPGVADVSCMSGTCQVSACDLGYTISADGSECIPEALSCPPALVVQNA